MGPLKDVKQVLLKVSKAFGITIATVKQKKQSISTAHSSDEDIDDPVKLMLMLLR